MKELKEKLVGGKFRDISCYVFVHSFILLTCEGRHRGGNLWRLRDGQNSMIYPGMNYSSPVRVSACGREAMVVAEEVGENFMTYPGIFFSNYFSVNTVRAGAGAVSCSG